MRLGGQSTPRGGDKTNRYTSERPRIISVRANISAGQSRNSSVMEPLVREYQTEADVGSSLRELSVGTSCSWWAIIAFFPLLIPLSGGTMARCQFAAQDKRNSMRFRGLSMIVVKRLQWPIMPER